MTKELDRIRAANGAAYCGDAGVFVVLPVDGEWLMGRGSDLADALDAIDAYDGTGDEVVPYLCCDQAIARAQQDAGEDAAALVEPSSVSRERQQ